MCGISGIVSNLAVNFDIEQVLRSMTESLHHRGPDYSGLWFDKDIGIGFGHSRLSILELSPDGHQPMTSKSGRYLIVFNGEIYNFFEIRKQLEMKGHHFIGGSDTEVMLAAIEEWGLEGAVKKFVGMFAFALFDKNNKNIHIVRDRFGEKPLYYGWIGNNFIFASELKAFKAFPKWDGAINRDAIALLMQYNHIPAPHTIFKDIYKVLPGNIISIKLKEAGSKIIKNFAYWSAKEAAENGTLSPFIGDERDAIEELNSILLCSIREKMIADVPLGAFLSGGIDSSSIVSLMQFLSDEPIKTFSIGFHESGYDEAPHAKAVSRQLGTDHTEYYVPAQEALAVIPKLPILYDEPFADSSQIPTFLVSKLARKSVTVALSGDGGDELFGGYTRHLWVPHIWGKIEGFPLPIRRFFGRSLNSLSADTWSSIFEKIDPLLPRIIRQRDVGYKIQKLGEALSADSLEKMYVDLASLWKVPSSFVKNASEVKTILSDSSLWPQLPDLAHKIMFWDMVCYLPNDVLVKVDRAAMGVSLETRIPFLDHRVVEFCWKLPISLKIRNGQGKWILRQILKKYLPYELVDRPKMGFALPIDAWLRGPLKDWAENLLDEKRMKIEGFFETKQIRKKWNEHLLEKRNWQHHLWNVLMFQAWLENEK